MSKTLGKKRDIISPIVLKNKGGRPTKVLTQKQIEEVEVLARFLTIEQIADYLSIGERTFLCIRQRQPKVDAAYKRGKMNAIVDIGSSLYAKAKNGDTTSQIFYLKTQAGWREKQYVEVNHDTSKTFQPVILTNNNSKIKDAHTN